MSQMDISDCVGFSTLAWRSQYQRVIARIDAVFAHWAQEKPDPWKQAVASGFRIREREWEAWGKKDCELRSEGSLGGSAHSTEFAQCVMRHLAYRTIDLSPDVEWWESR